jgi:hypothetical protein
LSFLKYIFFSPNLMEKPLFAYTEYARNARSFLNICPINFFLYKTLIFMSNCFTTGKPARSFATERVSLDSV